MSSPKPLFRSVKKHKALRKRPAEDIEEPQPTPSEAVPASITDKAKRLELDDSNAAAEEDGDTEAILAEKIHRQRGLRRRKGLGIEFTPESGTADHSRHMSEEVAKTDENPEDETIKAITSRFVGHTGQKVDVDEHMMEYIESELAKRRHGSKEHDHTEQKASEHMEMAGSTARQPTTRMRQAATLGKLHEVDLGPDTRLRNINRTAAATRHLTGDSAVPDQPMDKPDTEEHGKGRRGRDRRSSEDLRRDQLVEEVLRESRLDVYDELDEPMEGEGDDLAADDRIAEKFRKDFMDAIQSRRRRARTTKPANKAKQQQVPRGPKLGGSRSARAAMRQQQTQNAPK